MEFSNTFEALRRYRNLAVPISLGMAMLFPELAMADDWGTFSTALANAQTALAAVGTAVLTTGVPILAAFAGLNALKRFAFSVV
jgi:hypothetical protein